VRGNERGFCTISSFFNLKEEGNNISQWKDTQTVGDHQEKNTNWIVICEKSYLKTNKKHKKFVTIH
jgi:hypothetical protein